MYTTIDPYNAVDGPVFFLTAGRALRIRERVSEVLKNEGFIVLDPHDNVVHGTGPVARLLARAPALWALGLNGGDAGGDDYIKFAFNSEV